MYARSWTKDLSTLQPLVLLGQWYQIESLRFGLCLILSHTQKSHPLPIEYSSPNPTPPPYLFLPDLSEISVFLGSKESTLRGGLKLGAQPRPTSLPGLPLKLPHHLRSSRNLTSSALSFGPYTPRHLLYLHSLLCYSLSHSLSLQPSSNPRHTTQPTLTDSLVVILTHPSLIISSAHL